VNEGTNGAFGSLFSGRTHAVPNDFSAILSRLVARTLPVLRQNSVMPRVVSRMAEFSGGGFGSSVDVPLTSAVQVSDVTPGYAATAPIDSINPTYVTVTVDQWKEASFGLTDKEILEIGNSADYMPRQVEEAIKALANTVDAYILTELKKGVPFSVGTIDVTPFATDATAYTAARARMNKNLAPVSPRSVILDVDAEANALNLRAFQDASWAGSAAAIQDGMIGRKLGADWWVSQNIASHTQSAATGYQLSAAASKGAKTISVDTGSGTYNPGDVFTVAGDTLPYAVVGMVGSVITISPAVRVNLADNAALTNVASDGVINWCLTPDVLAFASRPLQTPDGFGSMFQQVTDPVSGLSFRLEVTRQHKQLKWSFDALYGAKVIRPEFGCRIYG
jgi:P22 coat protein - gene protein 5